MQDITRSIPSQENVRFSCDPSHVTVLMRNATFTLDGVECIQSMQNECGKQKGMRQILMERKKHLNDQGHLLNLQCNFWETKTTDAERDYQSEMLLVLLIRNVALVMY
jgi:hypothetical protein